MGDSRSWAADMEDEIVVCKYGKERKYFDNRCWNDVCQCVVDSIKRNADRELAKRMIEPLVDLILSLPESERNELKVGVKTKKGWIYPR